jgi:glutaminyl-tRNA synthetase
LGYFNTDKDSREGKLVLIKQLDLKTWKKKGKKEFIDEYPKEINKYVKEKTLLMQI